VLTTVLTDDAELRLLEPWHAEEFAAHLDEARDYLAVHLSWGDRVVDVDTARKFLQGFADKLARDEARLYGVWLDGGLVGGALFPAFDAATKVCEVGVWLVERATGRGLVTQAVGHLIDWAVFERGMVRVEWYAAAANERSLAVATRLGFTKEGTLRQSYAHRTGRLDMEVWSVLADEWRARSVSKGE